MAINYEEYKDEPYIHEIVSKLNEISWEIINFFEIDSIYVKVFAIIFLVVFFEDSCCLILIHDFNSFLIKLSEIVFPYNSMCPQN